MLSVQTSLTYNTLNFGGRASLQIDPMAEFLPRLPFGLFVDAQGGFAAAGNVPGHADRVAPARLRLRQSVWWFAFREDERISLEHRTWAVVFGGSTRQFSVGRWQ